ncbi:MAG: SH3 domain-containing protein [Cyanobacteria bacterium P01_E01_bin.42]
MRSVFQKFFGLKSSKRKAPQGFSQILILEEILTPSNLIGIDFEVDSGADLTEGFEIPGDGDIDIPDDLPFPNADDGEIAETQTREIAESVADVAHSDRDYEVISYIESDPDIEEAASVDIDLPITTTSTIPEFTSGVFTVGESGTVEIDYLYDGGKYQFELAIFSLTDIDAEPGSEEFIQIAAQRALSGSEEGHIIISDRVDAARFDGSLGESTNWNSGAYQGVRRFEMNSGDTFCFMLVPNGRVEDVAENPAIGGAKTPLFSLSTANPDDSLHFGQIADITGDGSTFAFEDVRHDHHWYDRDYNDLIFQVRGATGDTPLMDDLIDPADDWRDSDMGQALIEYAKPYIEPEDLDAIATDPEPDIAGDRELFDDGEVSERTVEEIEGNIETADRETAIAEQTSQDIFVSPETKAIQGEDWAQDLLAAVDEVKASDTVTPVFHLDLNLTEIDPEGNEIPRSELTSQELAAIAHARNNGIILVVPAGDNAGEMSALGELSHEFDNVITIGAAERVNDAVAVANAYQGVEPSGEGLALDIVADGTSGETASSAIAAAKVEEAIAKVWEANPELNYTQVIDILKRTATDLETANWDGKTGYGLLNVIAAVSLAKATKPETYDSPSSWIPEPWSEAEKVTGNSITAASSVKAIEKPINSSSIQTRTVQPQTLRSQTGYVNYIHGVNFRAGSSTSSSIIQGLSNRTSVTILRSVNGGLYRAPNGATRSDWYQVRVRGRTGYIAAAFVNKRTPPTTNSSGYVNYSRGVNFRTGASTGSRIIRGLSHRTPLTILSSVRGGTYRAPNGATRSDWYRVRVNGTNGYIAAAFVNQGTPPTTNSSGYVNYSRGVNFRMGSSTGSRIIRGLSYRTPLTILSSVRGGTYRAPNGTIRSDWYQVRVHGRTGYIAAAFVNKGSSNGVSGSYNRQAVVNYARQYWDKKNPAYRFYGSNNCANFVSQCLVAGGLFPKYSTPAIGNYSYTHVVGLNNNLLNNGLAEQVAVGYLRDANIKHHIWNTLKPGDVILHDWSNNGYNRWDHADIYLGNGIIASNTKNRYGNIFALRSSSTKVKLLRIKR